VEELERLRHKLIGFYACKQIFATEDFHDFQCPKKEDCYSAALHGHGKFTPAREAQLGMHYGRSGLRIVVVSADPGNALSLEKRKAQIWRKRAEDLGTRPDHWARTHEGVQAIVKAVTGEDITTPNDAHLWFAHVSVVRCSANLGGKRQAPAKMYRNCRDYLKGEIPILAPNVIWTQGEQAWWAMSWLARRAEGEKAAIALSKYGVRRVAPIDYAGRAIVIHTVHPAPRATTGANQWKWKEAMRLLQTVGKHRAWLFPASATADGPEQR
jgi:hypothetical protein